MEPFTDELSDVSTSGMIMSYLPVIIVMNSRKFKVMTHRPAVEEKGTGKKATEFDIDGLGEVSITGGSL
jgi:hypothetical protein